MKLNAKDFNEKLSDSVKQEIADNAKLVARVFSGDDGKKLLDLWFNNFVCTCNDGATEAELRRADAKREFVLNIKQSIELSSKLHHNKK